MFPDSLVAMRRIEIETYVKNFPCNANQIVRAFISFEDSIALMRHGASSGGGPRTEGRGFSPAVRDEKRRALALKPESRERSTAFLET